jgi:hypothetical protein
VPDSDLIGSDEITVLLIAGVGRSGSTLIDRALGAAPGCTSVGELVRIWERGLVEDALCGCGETFSTCAFWGDVGDTAFGGWDALDAARMLALRRKVDRIRFVPFIIAGGPRSYRASLAEYLSFVQRLYRAIGTVSGDRIVVDSSKDVSTAYLLTRASTLDVRVLHLVRDPRAVAYSWTKHVAKPGTSVEMDRYPPVKTAGWYVAFNVLIHALRLFRVPMRFLRYEDFTRDPGGQIAAVLGFVGDVEPRLSHVSGRTLELGPHHSMGGNPMRFQRGAIEVRRDDVWRQELPAGDRRIVTALTLPLLALYRYVPARGRP